MGIDELFTSYQKKIGTYDKQQWEKTIEGRISKNGLNHIQMRSTKPNTDLIDLDLVQGSSFTKAKPKHGFMTVARLATARYIFLPLYAKWWVQQTSSKVFALILLLYLSQMANIAIYYVQSVNDSHFNKNISIAELVIPFVMMWVLSLIHSQIVATNPAIEDEVSKTRITSKSKPFRSGRSLSSKIRNGNAPNNKLFKLLKEANDKSNSPITKVPKKKTRNKIIQFIDIVKEKPENSLNVELVQNTPVVNITPRINNYRSYRRLNSGVSNKTPIDDDGFESLNGNGSRTSEEEQGISKKPIVNVNKINNANDEENKNKTDLEVDSPNDVVKVKCEAWIKDVRESIAETPSNNPDSRYSTDSDSEPEIKRSSSLKKPLIKVKRRNSHIPTCTIDSTCDTEEEGETLSSPETGASCRLSGEFITPGVEWTGVTTNSEDCSYTSDLDECSDGHNETNHDHMVATSILTPPSTKVSCTIWEEEEIKKAELSVLDISSAIITKVDSMPESRDYFYCGMIVSTLLAFFPAICRLSKHSLDKNNSTDLQYSLFEIFELVVEHTPVSLSSVIDIGFGSEFWERISLIIILCQRLILSVMFFFLLSVAERTFKQRFLYAKLFSHLTSSQKARKLELPHFRLNKVRNIKTWLSVRSYLKKRGPQRSVDVIVSAAFIITLLLLSFICLELLKDTVALNSQYNVEALIWCVGLGMLLLRFMTLGTKINKKYRNLSILITEQINLHLQIEQKPHKKEELTVANNVLKLAIDLLKELDSPFKISGLSANPILYNITKVIILSALSGVLSEMLGFKLKLHKIKLK